MNTILIIDDNDMFCGMLKQLLENEGYDVVVASDGNSGINHFQENKPDLVICDLIMPEKEGLETITVLQRIDCKTPIIAVSGGGRVGPEMYLELAETMGARHTFSKPFVSREFLKAVAECL